MTAVVAQKNQKKHSLLPVLTVLFMVSYGLMTMLIVEQGSVIQSQGNLIKVLLPESTELWKTKGKALGEQQMAKNRAQHTGQSLSGQAQVPPAPNATVRGQSTETSKEGAPQTHTQNRTGRITKPGTHLPPVPATDLVDHRRSLVTI